MAMQAIIAQAAPLINTGDNAWMLISCALVLLMTPGLSLFYAGLVPSRNAINTMNMSFICLAVIPIVWVLLGYSLAFAPGNGFIGSLHFALLNNVTSQVATGGTTPEYDSMIFQCMFAIVTPALISGAMVGRMRFKVYILFAAIWSLCVYSVVAHWVWSPTGWLNRMGAIDFAGGTVVHINAGFSALVATIMLSKERNTDLHIGELPHNIPLVMLGASLLWFGWFGFNAGSAGAANAVASLAFTTTTLATAAAAFVWMMLSWGHSKPITAVGSAIAVVVGLVAITPASGYVSPLSAMVIGALAAITCFYAIIYKGKIIGKVEDPLDVFICHGISGVVGSLLTGVFASKLMNPNGEDGLFYGNPMLLYDQFIAVMATILMCTIGTAIILLVLKRIVVIDPAQSVGDDSIDELEHGESAYELNTIVKELFDSKKSLESVNNQLVEEIAERKRVESKAATLNSQLVVAARRAGMTDIATSVLHNIGNVLNSINTSVSMMDERIRQSEVGSLNKLKNLLQKYESKPEDLLLKDAHLPKIIEYITIIANSWEYDEKYILNEIKELEKSIIHIKNIINMQQSLGATIGVTEATNVVDLVEDALTLNKITYERADIEIIKNYREIKAVVIDRVKLLQIIVNLIKNSLDSLLSSDAVEKRLTLDIHALDDQFFVVSVSDNGLGIRSDNLTKIFSYGFTTKKNGHGFGLHTSALAAQEMGGKLLPASEGEGKGATFTLTLPYEPTTKGKRNAPSESETDTVG